MKLLLLLVSLILLINSSQDIPIPKTPYGLSVGDLSGNLHIQAFYDLLCPDSKASDAILQSVFRTISMTKSSIKFTYNMFPLPYHLYAFKITQGFEYILRKSSNAAAEQYIHYIFDNQDNYAEQKWLGSSINQFTESFSKDISNYFTVNQAEFKAALNHGSSSDAETRYEWKYGTSLGVSGAPVFYANGIRIDGAGSWKYGDWINFFTKYTTVRGAKGLTRLE